MPSARTSFLCYNNPESPTGSDGYAQVRGFLFLLFNNNFFD